MLLVYFSFTPLLLLFVQRIKILIHKEVKRRCASEGNVVGALLAGAFRLYAEKNNNTKHDINFFY